MKTLYITDLDGTLLNTKQEISEKSREILNGLLDKGLLFSVATARSPVSALPLLEGLKVNLPLVLMNGVMLYDPARGKAAEIKALPEETARRGIEGFEACGCPPYVYSFDDGIRLQYKTLHRPESAAFFEARRDGYKSLSLCAEYDQAYPVIYINMMGEAPLMSGIKSKVEEIPGVRIAYYPDNYDEGLWFLEVFSGEADKGRSAARVAKLVGAERIVAFGDNYNDLPLLQAADKSFAVAGAPEEVRQAAGAVIGTNEQDAVAECIKSLFESH